MELQFIENVDGQKYSYKNNDVSNDINSFDSCSALIPKDYIVVDIDGWQDDELLNAIFDTFDCRTYYTKTQGIGKVSGGYHLYYRKFRNQRVREKNGICYLGTKIELKTETVCERLNGVSNEVVPHEVSEFPEIFKIIKNAQHDLLGLEEGNRDNLMFTHSRLLLNSGIEEFKVNIILEFINNNFLLEPLDDVSKFTNKEYRKEAVKESMTDKANKFMSKYNTIIFDDMLYCRINDSYTADVRKVKRAIGLEFDDLSIPNIVEVYNQCELKSDIVESNKFPINCVGGHIVDGQYFDFTYTGFTPFYINYAYDESVPVSDAVEQLLNHLTSGDEQYRKLLLQVLAYPLIYDFGFKRHHRLISFIVGGGKNGKGTLIELLTKLYGENNISTCTIEDLTDQNMLNTCKNKLLNIGDDIEDSAINTKAMKRLKSISTADSINTRELYTRGTSSRIACALLFTSNHILKSFEKGASWTSRVKWLPAYKKIENAEQTFLKRLLTNESIMYFFKLLIQELPDLYSNGFIQSDVVDEFNILYSKINNNCLAFCDDMEHHYDGDAHLSWLLNIKPKEVYKQYEDFCMDMGEKPLSSKVLRETLEQRYDVKVVETTYKGNKYRQYVSRDHN